MVVALHVPVDGEVLLDDLGAQRDRRDRHVYPALVAGVANRAAADLAQALEVAQVEILEGRRVGGVALQQRERRTVVLEKLDRLADLGLGRHAGGEDQRSARRGSVGDQLVVREVGGGDLERRDAVVGKRVDAGKVPRSADHGKPAVRAVVEHPEERLGIEREAAEQVEGVLRSEVLAGPDVDAAPPVEGRHVAELELDAVGARDSRLVDQALREIGRAVVVDPDLGDDHRRRVGADHERPDPDLVRAVDGHGDDATPVVHQRDVVDAGAEQGTQLATGRVDRRRRERAVGDRKRAHVDVDAAVLGDPAADVAVGEHTLEQPVLGGAEDHARLVGGDLLEGARQSVL